MAPSHQQLVFGLVFLPFSVLHLVFFLHAILQEKNLFKLVNMTLKSLKEP